MWRPRWSLRLVALGFVSVLVTGAVLPLDRAVADSVADKRAQAARIAAQIDADRQRVDSLTARFEAAQLAVSDVDARIADASAALDTVKRRIAETGGALRNLAIAQFTDRGPTANAVPAMVGAGDPRRVTLAQVLVDLAASRAQDALDANRAAQEDYQARLKDLRTEQQRAHTAAANLAGAQTAAEAAVARQQADLGRVRGDLAQLVAAEAARQQAAREAQTRAAVARNPRPPRPDVSDPRTAPANDTPAPPVDAGRAATAVDEARRQLGKPYRWGAAGPDSFDCSGLTMWAWRAAGVSLPHYTGAQYSDTMHIRLDQLQPGDLVFFHRDLSHVGIYVGNGQMIHAPQTGDVVRYASIYSEGSPIYAGRVTG